MKDVVIIGGGLAGLINAIRLAKAGIKVVLLEKQDYPFHKVCGEYISNETLPFLQSLDINPFEFGAIPLTQFRLTSPKGSYLEMPLDLGGFGISRFKLDKILMDKAQSLGCEIFTKTNVLEIKSTDHRRQKSPNPQRGNSFFSLPFGETRTSFPPLGARGLLFTDKGDFEAKIVIGAYGKRANLDNFLGREFFRQRSPYMGVKYHIKLKDLKILPHPDNLIALHNFKNGYCGISRIEEDKFCLCYLTTRQNLKDYQSIENLELKLLRKNKYLNDVFENAEFLYDKPKVINEISFAPKPLIENGVLMCGDAAGMIAPLCGNGMAMAIHGAKILSDLLIQHFQQGLSKENLEKEYQARWRKLFATRLWLGRNVQKLFDNPFLTEILLQTAKNIRPLGKWIVKNTHGKEF